MVGGKTMLLNLKYSFTQCFIIKRRFSLKFLKLAGAVWRGKDA